jgi:hypothetical protein
MSTTDYILLEKLKKKCNTQEEELESFFESLHDAIQKNKPIPKCVNWNYVKVLNHLFTFNTSISKHVKSICFCTHIFL